MSTGSDSQHQDFGAIEAAVKGTARGRAFLANYARRVQQSDSLTALAMLGRLERLSDELKARLVDLEAVQLLGDSQKARPAVGIAKQRLMAPTAEALPKTGAEDGHFSTYRAADLPFNAQVTGRDGNTMQRIHALSELLGRLHRQAARLASDGQDAGTRNGVGSSNGGDANALFASESAGPWSESAFHRDVSDEEVLEGIARALVPPI